MHPQWGRDFWKRFIKISIAMGANDTVLISNKALAGSDAFVAFKVLAEQLGNR